MSDWTSGEAHRNEEEFIHARHCWPASLGVVDKIQLLSGAVGVGRSDRKNVCGPNRNSSRASALVPSGCYEVT